MQTETPRLDRLEALADFLETKVPDRKFDMETFASGPNCKTPEVGCGTTACAAGWATVLFRADGFTMSYDGLPQFEGKRSFAAVENFFRITEKDSDWLFLPYYRDDVYEPAMKGEVIARIRDFVREHRKEGA